MSKCNFLTMSCLRKVYLKLNSSETETLFSGLHIKDGSADIYIKAPFLTQISGQSIELTSIDKRNYIFNLSQTKYSLSKIKKLLGECNCCVDLTKVGNNIFNLTNVDQLEDILDPKENDTAFIVFGGDTYKTSFVGGVWQGLVQINNEDIDLSAIPQYTSHALAFAALGANRRFRYTQDNTDGVPSPNNSVHAITKA